MELPLHLRQGMEMDRALEAMADRARESGFCGMISYLRMAKRSYSFCMWPMYCCPEHRRQKPKRVPSIVPKVLRRK